MSAHCRAAPPGRARRRPAQIEVFGAGGTWRLQLDPVAIVVQDLPIIMNRNIPWTFVISQISPCGAWLHSHLWWAPWAPLLSSSLSSITACCKPRNPRSNSWWCRSKLKELGQLLLALAMSSIVEVIANARQLVPVSNCLWKIVKTGAQARQDLTRAQFPPALVSYLWHVNVAILQLSPANVMRNQVVEQPPSGYDFKCGPFCRCADFFGSEWGLSIDDCAAKCADEWGFIFAPFGPPGGSTDCRCCRDLEEVGSISPCDYSIDSMVFVCTLCGRHPRWPTHQYFWCPTLHSSQPGHLFTVALLRGGHGPFRRDCRNQEASRRIGKSMPIIQVASPSQRIQRACFSSTTRQNPCGKCSRSLHRTASGRHGKETKSGSWTR